MKKAMHILAVAAFIAAIVFVKPILAHQGDDATRKLWDTAFVSPAKVKKTGTSKSTQKRYRIATPTVPTENVAPDTVIGVTIWRLRQARSAERGERLIVHESAGASSWLPERISAETRLDEGDRLRLSIEAARKGYLYVIDREQYSDGSLGEPYLIFPTKRTLNGENQVSIGKLIDIPSQEDDPPYFTVRRTRVDQVADILSVLVTPTPLANIEITDKAQKLDPAQIASWEKSWSSGVGWLELANSGQPWTRAEKEAVNDTRSLVASSPPPHLLFYRPGARTSEPLFVRLHLWYKPVRRSGKKG